MFKKTTLALCLVAASAAITASVIAKSKPTLVSNMQAYLVKTNAEGKEYRQPARETEPGQTIEYNLTYNNQTKKSLKDLVVSGPIPANTTYIGRSARTRTPSELMVSIDGGRTFEREPVRRKERLADGSTRTVVIPAERYTNIRWNVKQPIAGLGRQAYTYRVKVK